MTIAILAPCFKKEAKTEGMRVLKGKKDGTREGVKGNKEPACVPRTELLGKF